MKITGSVDILPHMKRARTRKSPSKKVDVQATKAARVALQERLKLVQKKLPEDNPNLEDFFNRVGDRSEAQLVEEITSQIGRSNKWSARLLVSLSEWNIINEVHISGKLRTLCEASIIAEQNAQIRTRRDPSARFLKTLHSEDLASISFNVIPWPLYIRARKEFAVRLFIYMDGPFPFRATPGKEASFLTIKDAKAAQKKWRLESPHEIVVIEDVPSDKKSRYKYVVKCWSPFDFLEAELPWVDPAEIIYDWLGLYCREESSLLEKDTWRWRGGNNKRAKSIPTKNKIIEIYKSLSPLPKYIGEKRYLLFFDIRGELQKINIKVSVSYIEKVISKHLKPDKQNTLSTIHKMLSNNDAQPF